METSQAMTLKPTPPMRDLPEAEQKRREALAGRLFGAGLQTFELFAVHLGTKLGYYKTLEQDGPLNAKQLAKKTNTSERYAREWLEQQAVAGILEVSGMNTEPSLRTFGLPTGHAEVLLDEESLFYLGFMPTYAVVIPPTLAKVEKAFRTGGGVPWSALGTEGWQAQAKQNRPFLTHLFAKDFLANIPAVNERLARPGARVLDLACGAGWGALGVARAYPGALVDGYDLDREAIQAAKKNAVDHGLQDRVRFFAKDAATAAGTKYDLVTIVEALHDMSQPVKVLKTARKLLSPGGSVVVVDEKVADAFTAPGSDPERFFYSASLVVCLPNGLADQPSAATGTMMRPDTLKRYAKEAGFQTVEVLALQHDFFRFYRLSG